MRVALCVVILCVDGQRQRRNVYSTAAAALVRPAPGPQLASPLFGSVAAIDASNCRRSWIISSKRFGPVENKRLSVTTRYVRDVRLPFFASLGSK